MSNFDKAVLEKRISKFLDNVRSYSSNDNGYCACLRRSAGVLMRNADGKAIVCFYKACFPGISHDNYLIDRYFFAACVQCMWNVEDLERAVPIECCARGLDENSRNVVGKRLESLLDLDWDNDGYLAVKLLRLIKFCKSKGIVVNCKSLLFDLVFWNSESRVVQKKWIREFYNFSYVKKEE